MTEGSNQSSTEINERAQHLLKILVERYIGDGQPIGSRTLSRDSGLDLSAATVRNVMADLEELGFLHSPHTSAGRVPTVQGYRFFVDSLLSVDMTGQSRVADELRSQFKGEQNTGELMQAASSMLSDFTKLAGVVMMPRRKELTLKQVEFVPLSEKRVLAILVINAQEVQNRVILTERDYGKDELQRVANYFNEHFAGHDLNQMRGELLAQMEADRESLNDMMAGVIEMADKTFEFDASATEDDFVLEGQNNLIGAAELSDLQKLRQLFEAFNQKREILHLLDHCMQAQGVQIFIGEESGYQVLDECSVVTAPYSIDGQVLGVLGVIGPTRMAYDRVIPIVDVTAKLLAAALNSR